MLEFFLFVSCALEPPKWLLPRSGLIPSREYMDPERFFFVRWTLPPSIREPFIIYSHHTIIISIWHHTMAEIHAAPNVLAMRSVLFLYFNESPSIMYITAFLFIFLFVNVEKANILSDNRLVCINNIIMSLSKKHRSRYKTLSSGTSNP